jgi:hypothetical protein
MGVVIVGVDPHKKSVTFEAIDEQGQQVATGRFGTTTRDYKTMLRYARRQWPHHRWVIEGAQGVGRPLAQRLLFDGETDPTSRPSSRRGCGCSTPATPARPTPPVRTRLRRQRCGHRTFGVRL